MNSLLNSVETLSPRSFKLLVKLEKLKDMLLVFGAYFSGRLESLLMSLLETQGGEYALLDHIALQTMHSFDTSKLS